MSDEPERRVEPENRRVSPFTEKLSYLMAWSAALGGAYVILDPVITFSFGQWVTVKVGGEGFSEQLKGAVVALILIEGWKAVKEYWLGSSAGTAKSAEAMQRIAEASPVSTAAALAADVAAKAAAAKAAAKPDEPTIPLVPVGGTPPPAPADAPIKP